MDRTLIRKLDTVYSKYIRFKKEYARCISCGKIDAPERMDAGHYVSREVMNLRYDDRNVHPQCRKCNRFKEGMKDEYALALIKLYGPDILETLNKEKYIIKKYYEAELKELIKYYAKEIKKRNISR